MLAALGQTYQVSKIEKALEQFSCQIWGIAAGLNSWWLLVEQSLVTEELSGADFILASWLSPPRGLLAGSIRQDQESRFESSISKSL